MWESGIPKIIFLSILLTTNLAMGQSARNGDSDPELPVGTLVKTKEGWVQGFQRGQTLLYRGIPFAAPPVSDLRFAPPQPHDRWVGILDASTLSPRCAQVGVVNGAVGVIGNENCLTLNIYAPVGITRASALPVMVFLHGGGNRTGTVAQSNSDLNTLPERNVILVTVEYRVNALGWIAFPELPGAASNGLLDQIAALHWVRKNIARFGGDPGRVMLFGQSAGATDTAALLASPKARGLFSRAAIESGSSLADSLQTSLKRGVALEKAVGCYLEPQEYSAEQVVTCLRQVPVSELVMKAFVTNTNLLGLTYTYRPVVDGVALTEAPLEAVARRGSVPLLLGTTRDEFAFFFVPELTEEQYEDALRNAVGANLLPGYLELYPAPAYPTPRLAYIDWAGDNRFQCPERALANAAVGSGEEDRPKIFKYIDTHTLTNNATLAARGTFHTQELNFVFGVPSMASFGPLQLEQFPFAFNVNYTPTAADIELSDEIQGYWTRFAATGDPNGDGAVTWPEWDPETQEHLRLDSVIDSVSGWHRNQCDFWDETFDPSSTE